MLVSPVRVPISNYSSLIVSAQHFQSFQHQASRGPVPVVTSLHERSLRPLASAMRSGDLGDLGEGRELVDGFG